MHISFKMKISLLLLLTAVLAFSGVAQARRFSLAQNGQTSGTNFGSALYNYMEAFENIMPCGFAPWNIPKLAPFTLPAWTLNLSKQYYGINANITNLVITGLNDIRFIQYDYDPVAQKLSFDIIYNEVQLLSEYNMTAWALLAGYKAQMAGNGPLNYIVKDARFIGEFTIATSDANPNGLMMTDVNLNFFIGDLLPYNWNYQWDISFNNFLNRWVRDSLLMYSEQIQVQVNSIFDYFVLPIVNNALENVSMSELISFFVQQTQLLNGANCNSNQS